MSGVAGVFVLPLQGLEVGVVQFRQENSAYSMAQDNISHDFKEERDVTNNAFHGTEGVVLRDEPVPLISVLD